MQMDDIIKKIIFLPRTFDSIENKSIYDLLKESGYFQLYNNISEKEIKKNLKNYIECIREWELYSENKRSDSGYYLQRDGKKYIVGYLDSQSNKKIIKKFNNGIDACAVFIKKEIENIRLLG